ncbi:NAD(P)H-dependent oxidoreductase [Streptomyces sp. NPDC021212]|uniref:NAD(P)H-dependent oxidoreductase n=1 Tax=Streptomyces sp. NPDC021212 TaxID=3365118 RepID=UPI00379E0E55
MFKAWLDQIMVAGRTLSHAGPSPVAGRPATVISARGGGYGPGAPKEGMDHLVPTLERLLGEATLGLDVNIILPELTMAPYVPMMAPLLPMHEASMTKAHDEARRLGSALTGRPAA